MIKRWWDPLIAAFQFLTRIKIPYQTPYDISTISRSALFFPAVGLMIGSILYVVSWLLPHGVSPVNAAVVLLLWTVLTGGLHMDGWMDTADGLGSHRSRERMLEIMKDSRVGAMGVMAGIFLLLIKWTSLWSLLNGRDNGSLSDPTLLFIFLSTLSVSRWWMTSAIVYWPYMGGKDGIGSPYQQSGGLVWAGASVIALLPLLLLPSPYWLWLTGSQIALGWLFTVYCNRRLGGMTGDTYGAMNEAVEAVGLLAAVYISL